MSRRPTLIQRPVQQARQAVEDGRAAFRIVAGADLAFRLVVDQHATDTLGGLFATDQVAIDGDSIVAVDPLAEAGHAAIDVDPAFGDPHFYVAPGTDAETGEDFLQFFPTGTWGFSGVSFIWAPPGVAGNESKGAHHTRFVRTKHRPRAETRTIPLD